MKKKLVRKVTSAKKIISKSHKKSKFSFKSWLFGGLVLVLVLAYGLFKLQPQPLKVLEVSGTLADYIPANPIDINIISPGNLNKLPKSDVPEVNAARDAVVAKQNAIKNGRSAEEAEKIAESAAERSVRESYQESVAAGAITMQDAINAGAVQSKANEAIKDDSGKTEAEKAAEYAKDVVRNIDVVKNADGTITTTKSQPATSQNVFSKGSCSTSAFSVYEGETVIGAGDKIYRCAGGSWQPVYTDDSKTTQCTTTDTNPACKVTVKPIYQQQQELKDGKKSGPNCYTEGGSVVVGYGSVVDVEGDSGRQCQGTSKLETVTNYKGEWMSTEKAQALKEEDRKKAEDQKKKDQDACRAQGHVVRDDGTCGAATEPSCASIGKVLDGSSCVDKKASSTKETCRAQGTLAFCQTTDSQGNVVSSRQANTTEECLPQGTQFKCKVYTTNANGEKVALRDYIKTGTIAKVNPSGIYQNGEKTSKESDCIYGGDPIEGSGSSQGVFYNCRNSSGAVPRTLTSTNFGSSSSNAGKECDGTMSYVDDNGEYTSMPSCSQLCGGAGSYPKDGKLYCNALVPSTPTIEFDKSKPTEQYPNAGKECDGTMSYVDDNGEYTSMPSCSQLCGGAGSYPQDGKLICSNGGPTTDTNKNNAVEITCPTGSTIVNNTCVAENLNPDFMKRDDGEACTNKRNCEATCDGEYIVASVKNPGKLFASTNYYCGNEELVSKILNEAGNPYTIKSTTQLTPDSLETDPDVQARLADMKQEIIASGDCNVGNIDKGIRAVCKEGSNEPVFEFCDGGYGTYEKDGTCKPAQSNATTNIVNNPNAGKNAAIGAVGLGGGCLAAAALVGMGTAPLAVITAPATLAICGGFTVLGGMLGAGTP